MIDEYSIIILSVLGALLVAGTGAVQFIKVSAPAKSKRQSSDEILESFVKRMVRDESREFKIDVIRRVDEGIYSKVLNRYLLRVNESVECMRDLEELSQKQKNFFIAYFPTLYYQARVEPLQVEDFDRRWMSNRSSDFDFMGDVSGDLRKFCIQMNDFSEKKVDLLINIVRSTADDDRKLIAQIGELRERILKLEAELARNEERVHNEERTLSEEGIEKVADAPLGGSVEHGRDNK